MSAAENRPRSWKTGLSRVKNGVIFYRATTITMEVNGLANSFHQRSTRRKTSKLFSPKMLNGGKLSHCVQLGGVIKACISPHFFFFLPGGHSWWAEQHPVCPFACYKLAKLYSLEEHISKFLWLRKQTHLLGSVRNLMGACVAPRTPGILCPCVRRTYWWL